MICDQVYKRKTLLGNLIWSRSLQIDLNNKSKLSAAAADKLQNKLVHFVELANLPALIHNK